MVWQPLGYAEGVLLILFVFRWLLKAESDHFGLDLKPFKTKIWLENKRR